MNVNNQPQNRTNLEYDNELNTRLENRYVPSGPLDILLDFRPLSTKYTLFHTNDPVQTTSIQYTKPEFNPCRGPVNNFMRNIDIETKLRSQYQNQNLPQNIYVPELNSQLYDYSMAYSPEYFSPTDALTQGQKCLNQSQTLFYNCIKSESKK